MDTKKILESLFRYCIEKKYPDIHLSTGNKIMVRDHNGNIIPLEYFLIGEESIPTPLLTKELMKNIIIEIIGYHGMDSFVENFELDTSYIFENSRYRISCYMDIIGFSVAMRLISSEIPSFEDLNLGETIKEMCQKEKGLILVTGPTGSGKSTNVASMIEYINMNYKKHIITIEDPVEFVFQNKQSLINQRQVGNHTKTFSHAIKAAMREDPDILMLGEMRDPETIKAAITLAETGHLVLSTLHTNDTVQSVDRIIDVFPANQQDQIRMQLAMSLVGIISQRLIPKVNDSGRVAAREILLSTDAIKNLIITGKTHQLYSVIEVSSKHGMILMDKYLLYLFKKGIISRDTLFAFVRDKDGLEMLLHE